MEATVIWLYAFQAILWIGAWVYMNRAVREQKRIGAELRELRSELLP